MSVIIVGGGMVGATLALAISELSHGTLPVHLIEASEPDTDRHPGFDARAIALPQAPASSWRELASGRPLPIAQPRSKRCTSATVDMPGV